MSARPLLPQRVISLRGALGQCSGMKVRLVEQTRLVNARKLAAEDGGVTAMAKRLKKSQSQLQNTIGKTPKKLIGPDLARDIEDGYGKTPGWLDMPWDLVEAEAKTDSVRDYHAVTDNEVLQMVMRELTRALVANAPVAAHDFAVLLREQAQHRGFETEAGLVSVVLDTAALGQSSAAAAVRRASQQTSADQPMPKKQAQTRRNSS